jgi:uncharacterized integral membrane protein (TIGR00698 family)
MITSGVRFAKAGHRGILLALVIATCATFLSRHYGAPAMLFALLIGMAFNFLANETTCAPGIEFAAKALLRIGVALLGFRLSLSDIAELGLYPMLAVGFLLVLTIASGLVLSPLLGRRWRFGLLTGGAVAICGASAALAISAVLPQRKELERDTLFTVVAVTTLSTFAMVVYPVVFRALGLDDRQTGFLIGATIHDVAQVMGAGYSVSAAAGDLAALVKLERVILLPVVLLVLILSTGRGEAKRVRLPAFVVAFVAIVVVNSFVAVPAPLREAAAAMSQWLLVTAIAALGVKTSLAAILGLGGQCS